MHDVGPTQPKLGCFSPPSEEGEASIVPYKIICKALRIPKKTSIQRKLDTERIGALCYVAFFLVFWVLMSLSAQGRLPVMKLERSFTHETLILSAEAMQETIMFPIALCFIYLPIIFGNAPSFDFY